MIQFALPAGHTDPDGDFDATDLGNIGGTYDVREDVNLDGTVDTSDAQDALTINGGYVTLGRGVLSNPVTANRRGYAGYEYDPTFEGAGGGGVNGRHLYHVRHRVYDADVGRWTRQDPLGYIDEMSLYGYVRNSPLAHADATGQRAAEGNHAREIQPEPLSDEECCKRAARGSKRARHAAGYIACCGGRAVVCVNVDLGCDKLTVSECHRSGCKIAETVIRACSTLHETVHLPDIQPCDPNAPPDLSDFKPGVAKESECRAYRASLACLQNKLAECDELLRAVGLDPNDRRFRSHRDHGLTKEQRCALANWWKCRALIEAEIRNDEAGVRNNCPPEDPADKQCPPGRENNALGAITSGASSGAAACPEGFRW